MKKFKSYREFQENSHRGDLQNPFTWKTRQFGESNMNLNIPAKTHTHTIQIFRKCNWNFIQPIMHGLEIQRVFTYCCCWCHPSGQYFFNLSSIYIYAINFEINEKEIATFLIVQKGFVYGFQAL